MVQGGIFGGKRICGIRYRHANYQNTLSPDPSKVKKCAEGYYLCNADNKNIKYQLCIKNDPFLKSLSDDKLNKEM